ncbi:hypothetical protein scyTo_0005667 [Scyliorhinus torazame]|uniref:ribonuclease H n=1 Tax=Scyliorhinus torazame TaxID=75743 RepID=A0A401PBA4_SCYTO|nr:hypothetical protein [Scyliorhinus torazame]
MKEVLIGANLAIGKNDTGLISKRFQHTIHGGQHRPQKQYPLTRGAKSELEIAIKELEQQGIIQKVTYALTNSSLQVVSKPDGTFRMITNYKALNKVTKKDKRYLINPQTTLEQVAGKIYLTSIDLANGFWSVPLDPDSREKTAFTFGTKHYVYCRLPQGYVNSPNHFQAIVRELMKDDLALVYIDDVLIGDDDQDKHVERVARIIKTLSEAGFKIGLKKCQIGRSEVNYLGYSVSKEGREACIEMRKKVAEITAPVSRKGVKKIMGILGYLRPVVKDFSLYAKPIYETLKGDFIWSSEAQGGLDQLKTAVAISGPLVGRQEEDDLSIKLDIYKNGYGMVLVNHSNQTLIKHLTGIWPRAEQKCSDIEKCLAAIIKIIAEIENLSVGKNIYVTTEFLELKELTKRQIYQQGANTARWERWETILLNPDLMFIHNIKKGHKLDEPVSKMELVNAWVLYTDGSKVKEDEEHARWAFILKNSGKKVVEEQRIIVGSAQTAEVEGV